MDEQLICLFFNNNRPQAHISVLLKHTVNTPSRGHTCIFNDVYNVYSFDKKRKTGNRLGYSVDKPHRPTLHLSYRPIN